MKALEGMSRRRFLGSVSAGAAGLILPNRLPGLGIAMDEIPRGERPPALPDGFEILNPRGRVPLSFIIDDSTCLVNMGHYCMPQFGEAWPERDSYKKDWKSWPREIPDDFVRKFGEWCQGHGVKGKYSVVPNPACVGWMDRGLPGWSKRELDSSLRLVRDFMMPDWDIHPEMISHTRVFDLKTGRPVEGASSATMENSWPQEKKSVDEMASYIAYALQVLKNVDLPCEGFTTPGGFGNLVKGELSLGGAEAVRDVFGVEVPHYFKYLETEKGSSTAPRVEQVSGLQTGDPQCMVNVVGGTGDWFGGWDGVSHGDIEESATRCISEDGKSGRMPEMIGAEEPAIMICHWPGMFCNGGEQGFRIFQKAVERTNTHFGEMTQWMKVSEIARYWAAKELAAVTDGAGGGYRIDAPFAAKDFTVRVPIRAGVRAKPFVKSSKGDGAALDEVASKSALKAGTWWKESDESVVACFDLEKGRSDLVTDVR